MEPQAITPKPPALESALTRCRSLTQLIAPPMMAIGQPRNAVPRDHNRSSRARAAETALSGGIEAVGGMQRAYGQLGVFGADEDGDFYLAGGNHLDVDALAGERRKHRAGDAGVAAHAGADHADLGDIG